MLFLVRMDVHLPSDMPAAEAEDLKARERAYSQGLQREGKWQGLYRVVGGKRTTASSTLSRMTNSIRCFPGRLSSLI
jgi:muconolactone delta-isomerase